MFKPGESGNPGGRKAQPPGVTKEFRDATPKCVQRLVKIVTYGKDGDAIRAADIILNRAWGAPTQRQEVTGADGAPLIPGTPAFKQLDPEEWVTVFSTLAQGRGPDASSPGTN